MADEPIITPDELRSHANLVMGRTVDMLRRAADEIERLEKRTALKLSGRMPLPLWWETK